MARAKKLVVKDLKNTKSKTKAKVDELSRSQKLYKKYLTRVSGLLSTSKDAQSILDELSRGQNSYLKLNRIKTSAFDTLWIEKIEDCIFDLGDIISNPRQNTKVTTDIIPVELARKVNAESVRHLASHTQYIKDIDERGDVIPNKILNISYEDDLHTYENRFIATLVRKLVLFIEKRYEFIRTIAPIFNEEVLYVKNRSLVNGSDVEIETKIKINTQAPNNNPEKLQSYLDRILQIREYVLYFYNSDFMKKLKTEKNVRNPILQTNIIRKNLKYHHCYELYKFIETYDRMGFDCKVDEKYELFSEEELKEINKLTFANYLACQNVQEAKDKKINTKAYKPKVLTSMDDESFVYGPLIEGPISFIRTDEQFREYYTNKIKKDLPLHPTKKEKEYYREEFSEKKEIKQDLMELDYLKKRVKKQTDRFAKLIEQYIKEREEEERRLEAERLAAIKAEEEAELNRVREAVVERAHKDFPTKQVSDIDRIIDEIINEGYDPNDVEFMEMVSDAVEDEAFLAKEAEKAREEHNVVARSVIGYNKAKMSMTYIKYVKNEDGSINAIVNGMYQQERDGDYDVPFSNNPVKKFDNFNDFYNWYLNNTQEEYPDDRVSEDAVIAQAADVFGVEVPVKEEPKVEEPVIEEAPEVNEENASEQAENTESTNENVVEAAQEAAVEGEQPQDTQPVEAQEGENAEAVATPVEEAKAEEQQEVTENPEANAKDTQAQATTADEQPQENAVVEGAENANSEAPAEEAVNAEDVNASEHLEGQESQGNEEENTANPEDNANAEQQTANENNLDTVVAPVATEGEEPKEEQNAEAQEGESAQGETAPAEEAKVEEQQETANITDAPVAEDAANTEIPEANAEGGQAKAEPEREASVDAENPKNEEAKQDTNVLVAPVVLGENNEQEANEVAEAPVEEDASKEANAEDNIVEAENPAETLENNENPANPEDNNTSEDGNIIVAPVILGENDVNEDASKKDEEDEFANTPVEDLPNAPLDSFKKPSDEQQQENIEDEYANVPVEDLPNAPTGGEFLDSNNNEEETNASLDANNNDSKESSESKVIKPVIPADLYDEDDNGDTWYVVRQFQGFYVDEETVTRRKHEAKIFKAESAVRRFKKTHYGRVKKYPKSVLLALMEAGNMPGKTIRSGNYAGNNKDYEKDEYANVPVEELPNTPTMMNKPTKGGNPVMGEMFVPTIIGVNDNDPDASSRSLTPKINRPLSVNTNRNISSVNNEPIDLYDEDDGSGIWYVVRQFQGYYVDDETVTRRKSEAKIFRAESAVRRFKRTHYGRVKRYNTEVKIPTLKR